MHRSPSGNKTKSCGLWNRVFSLLHVYIIVFVYIIDMQMSEPWTGHKDDDGNTITQELEGKRRMVSFKKKNSQAQSSQQFSSFLKINILVDWPNSWVIFTCHMTSQIIYSYTMTSISKYDLNIYSCENVTCHVLIDECFKTKCQISYSR